MTKKEVWEIIKEEDISENRKTIKSKRIFKIKCNGVLEKDWLLVDIVRFLE